MAQFQPPSQPTYPPPQYQQPPVKPKRRIPWLWIVASLLVGFLIGFAAHEPSSSSPAPTAPQQTTTASQPTTKPVTPTPTHVPKWTTVQMFSANGNKKTAVFTVPANWKILWSCTPSSSFGGSYNLIVDVNNADGTPLDPGTINTICQSGNTHDQTEEHQGGQVYLDVTSEGAWSLQIQVLK